MKVRAAALLGSCLACAALAADPPPNPPPYERDETEDAVGVMARFLNFNSDTLVVGFAVPKAFVRESMDEFGFASDDAAKILAACTGCDQGEYDRRVDQFYRDRGMQLETRTGGARSLYVDVPKAVQRNRPRLRGLAESFGALAKSRDYGPDETLGAVVAFVQTAMEYRVPPDREDGRDIAGFYPPPRALELGWGDCDTKSAVLASVLAAFSGVKVIGVHVPKHYLIGVARVPRHGDAYIEYQGEPFVLVEAAGPAWRPPGSISDTTRAALQTMEGVRIDPMFPTPEKTDEP